MKLSKNRIRGFRAMEKNVTILRVTYVCQMNLCKREYRNNRKSKNTHFNN